MQASIRFLAATAALAAAALPSLLAFNVSPSPTFLNQALAFALWGALAAAMLPLRPGRGIVPVLSALALIGLAVAWSWGPGALPASLALSALATLAAAAVLLCAGAGVRARAEAIDLFAMFCWAWLAAGLLNVVVALVQVFAPGWGDGTWIAASGLPGRAVGNLRQPNHLSSLLMWAAIATVALAQLRRLRGPVALAALAALVFAVVLTASRTGVLSVVLLALWGIADRRLARGTRALLIAAPLLYAVAWLGMAQWAAASQHTFGGTQRLAESDISASRFGIWADTLALIRANPWTGVGFGEFNLAWSLSVFPTRPVAFFDHTHNLPLQLAVELGLPLATLILALLLWALATALRRAAATPGDGGTAQSFALAMVLMIGLHSLLEYPLWYSYFLLPAAWAWGYALQRGEENAHRSARPWPLLGGAGALLVAGAALAVVDYARVAAIFSAQAGDAPLEDRIADGQRSPFFAHHADYAAVTSGVGVADPARAFDRATHYLLDTRLMMAWARALAARGELDAARHIAARLREFRNPDAAALFENCPEPWPAGSVPGASFACERPARDLGWRDFLPAGAR